MIALPSNVRVLATGDGVPVVMLHCLGVDHRLWTDAIGALGTGYRVFTYDLPGHGASATPAARYSIDDLADQLATIFEAQALSRAHVVGMSLGGCVAQAFAGRYPERVAKLVLADTTPLYPPALQDKWVERASIARSQGVGPLIAEKLTIWFTPDFAAAEGPQVRYVRDTLTACDGEGYALACEALGAADLRDTVRRIRAPTLITLGDGDLPPFHDAARWMNEAIPGSRVHLIEDARHAAPLQQSAAFAALLRRFFGES